MRSDREGGGAYTDEPAQYTNPHPELPDPYGGAPDPYSVRAVNPNANPDPYGAAPGRATAPPSAYRPQGPQALGQQGQGRGGGQDPTQRRTRVMELARKSSMAESGPGHYRAASAGGFDYRAGGGAVQNALPPGQQNGYGGSGAGQNGYGNGYGTPPPQNGYAPPPQNGNPNPYAAAAPPPAAQRNQSPHPSAHGREASLPPAPAQRMQTPAQRMQTPGAGAGAGRGYTLSDTGSRPGSVAGGAGVNVGVGVGVGGGGRAQGTPPLRRPGVGAAAGGANAGGGAGGAFGGPAGAGATGGNGATGGVGAHPGTGPATFAEMGFTGAKAEDKECVVM
ncbi:hypothetical protein B0H12DRAFT_1131346 [Mycena haematopus]|nr:hypothetical protein B0H12DRAFT_1131346 [Mycena haematopus]